MSLPSQLTAGSLLKSSCLPCYHLATFVQQRQGKPDMQETYFSPKGWDRFHQLCMVDREKSFPLTKVCPLIRCYLKKKYLGSKCVKAFSWSYGSSLKNKSKVQYFYFIYLFIFTEHSQFYLPYCSGDRQAHFNTLSSWAASASSLSMSLCSSGFFFFSAAILLSSSAWVFR